MSVCLAEILIDAWRGEIARRYNDAAPLGVLVRNGPLMG